MEAELSLLLLPSFRYAGQMNMSFRPFRRLCKLIVESYARETVAFQGFHTFRIPIW